MTRPYRSALYIPGSKPRALDKARGLATDVILFDLEDAVAPDEKPTARATLAAEDQGFRDRRSRFGGLFARGDRYFQAYSGQALDAHAALARFRNAGVAVPSAPPAP